MVKQAKPLQPPLPSRPAKDLGRHITTPAKKATAIRATQYSQRSTTLSG
ncbi:11283_t:CDS:2 [Paraglomus brasilianum]|uniref:11283_t:CDS:1 n=1 Tax=Paraglomus brasilianum TaxID=144538 RepID=A0A9N8VJI3_9GLOM|nr:11283_t:CDS:2 [Paraglomus brasilianum]